MRVAITFSPRDDDVALFDLDGVLTRTARITASNPMSRRSLWSAPPPITLRFGGEVCDFVGGTTRVSCLNDDAADGATHRDATADSHLKDSTTERTLL